MTGSLQEKNGKYYAVINVTENGKRKQKWIATGYETKGNKKRAEQFLRDKLKEYDELRKEPYEWGEYRQGGKKQMECEFLFSK